MKQAIVSVNHRRHKRKEKNWPYMLLQYMVDNKILTRIDFVRYIREGITNIAIRVTLSFRSYIIDLSALYLFVSIRL